MYTLNIMFVLIYTYIYKYIFIYNEYRYVYIIFVFQGIIYDTCCNYLSVEFFLPIFTYFVLWSILNQKISKILKNLYFEKFMPEGVKRLCYQKWKLDFIKIIILKHMIKMIFFCILYFKRYWFISIWSQLYINTA